MRYITLIIVCIIIGINGFSQFIPNTHVNINTNDLRKAFEENGFVTTPDEISDLWLWLDGGDSTTLYQNSNCSNLVTANNDKVGCWEDRSGNGRHFTQSTNNKRPEALLDTINGRITAVNFVEPSKDFLEHDIAAADELSNRDMTYFMVFQSNVVLQKNNAALFSSSDASNLNGSWEMDFKNTNNNFHHTARTGTGNVVAEFDVNVVDVKLYNFTYDYSAQEILTYVDGSQEGSSVLPIIETVHMKLGVNRQGSTYADAKISEVIIYDRKLSICEINEVILYLAIKYDQSSFQPIPVPGGVDCSELFFWLRTDVGTSTIVDGTPLTAWEDKAFSNREMTQANVANQPIYRDNPTDNINYNAVVEFDGTNDYLKEVSVIGNTNDNLTIYLVAKEDTRKNNELLSLKESTLSTDRVLIESPDATGQVTWDAGTSTAPNTISGLATYPVGEPSITMFTSNVDSNFQEIFINGSLIVSDATGASLTSLDSTTLGGINNFYDGFIPELLIYETTFSAFQINNIDTYLAIKYGITLSHDYYSTDTVLIYDVSNGYANGIFGVGLDLLTALNQKKSKSQIIGEAVSFELTNFISDRQFLVSGHNGGGFVRTTLNGDANVLTQKWFAKMTGNVGTVNVELDLANVGANTGAAPNTVKIIVSNNPAFTNPYFIEATSVIGGVALFEGIPLYNKYYTFSAAP